MDDDLDLLQGFLEESAELIAAFEGHLLELERAPGDTERLHAIFRAVHTIKGNSGMLGLDGVAQFAHAFEDTLDQLRKGAIALTPAGMNVLLRAVDCLKAMLAAVRDGAPVEGIEQRPVLGELAAMREAPTPLDAPDPAPSTQASAPSVADGEEAEAGPKIPRLGELLVQEHGVSPRAVEAALGHQARVGEILVQMGATSPEDVERALGRQRELQTRQEAASIRVLTDKVDKLINLAGEMVITQSMLTQIVSKFTPDQLLRLTDAVAAMERHSRELQERVMAIRMQPIKSVFGRFPRLVRDLAQAVGKHVRLDISGDETELDKTVIDRIGDPLTHLVRNSVDHGIEPPEVRRQAGKPEQGVVHLKAFHEGGRIFIQIADDGKGFDKARIRHKAIEQGLAKEGEVLTDEQVYDLIFRPGFSTAEKVTDVSGRGVGMDVVRKAIEALGGQVAVESRPGRGCTITTKLPLTLAILDGLSVQVGDVLYIIPLVNITESVRPKRSQVTSIVGRGEVVDVRGQALPILRLYGVLGVTPRVTDPSQSLLVIVENAGEKVALLVDELLGQHQVVIKSLEANYRRIEGVSGATIMGDGRVALILDIPGLVRLAARRQAVRFAA